MNTYALGSAADDDAWQPVAAAAGLLLVAGYAAAVRLCNQRWTKLWTLRCLLFRQRSRARGRKLCRASAGIQSFAL